MILELDVGNTRAKWRLLDAAGARVDGGAIPRSALLGPAAAPWGVRPQRVRVASVAGADHDERLAQRLRTDGADQVGFARSAPRAGRVSNGYREPARLGVDRWLAVVAAAERCRGAVLVVDAGSALTVDPVTADGRHLGGWIVPGLAMMRSALLERTAGIRFDPAGTGSGTAPGSGTREAVDHGTFIMSLDFIRGRLAWLRDAEPSARLLVTGGDGMLYAEQLRESGVEVEAVPELVLDGLALVLD